jgi:hypothetical protein
MAPPEQSSEGTPDYEQCFAKRRRGRDWGLHETARAKTKVRKSMRKVTHTRHEWPEFAQKERLGIRLAAQWLTYTSHKSSIVRMARPVPRTQKITPRK